MPADEHARRHDPVARGVALALTVTMPPTVDVVPDSWKLPPATTQKFAELNAVVKFSVWSPVVWSVSELMLWLTVSAAVPVPLKCAHAFATPG